MHKGQPCQCDVHIISNESFQTPDFEGGLLILRSMLSLKRGLIQVLGLMLRISHNNQQWGHPLNKQQPGKDFFKSCCLGADNRFYNNDVFPTYLLPQGQK